MTNENVFLFISLLFSLKLRICPVCLLTLFKNNEIDIDHFVYYIRIKNEFQYMNFNITSKYDVEYRSYDPNRLPCQFYTLVSI
jgi:hypothetical protein